MKLRTAALVGIAIALIIVAACGDDDAGSPEATATAPEQLTLEQYFQRFEAVLADLNDQFEVLLAQFPQAFEDPAQTRDFFDASALLTRSGHDQLEDIDPPSDVEELHKEFLDVTESIADALEDFADLLADVESAEELQEALGQPLEEHFGAAGERSDAACLALERFAADNGIAADLDCEEEE